jgi:hypothetical protein
MSDAPASILLLLLREPDCLVMFVLGSFGEKSQQTSWLWGKQQEKQGM